MVPHTKTVPSLPNNSKRVKIAYNLEDLQSGTDCVFSIAPKVPAKGTLEIFENSIKFYHPDQKIPNTEPPERLENDIKDFSSKSRQRLFQKFNKINYSKYGIPIFLSLTWHYDDPQNKKSLKTFLRNFLKRLIRLLPPFQYIWKFEYQERGTPHFHIIIFPESKTYNFSEEKIKSEITRHWLELKQCKCDDCKRYAVKIVRCETLKMSLSYIAKEIAKVSHDYLEHDLGRIWGSSNNLDMTRKDLIEINLNDYEKFINKAIFLIEEKAKQVPPEKDFQLKRYQSSILYLQGLKYIPYNSTIFIPESEIKDLILDQKKKPILNKINNKLILKKYNWR